METKKISKEEIINSFGELLVEDNYPPIAGRILGLFYVTNKKHLTFEEIKESLNISKSATSKALSFLIKLKEVSFIYDENNKRLRLFYLDVDGSIERFNSIMKAYNLQTILFKEALQARNEENEELNHFIEKTILFHEDVIGFVMDKMKLHYKEFLKEN